MKKTIVHRSAVPFYTAAAAWAVYALVFPLYRVGHFAIAAAVTLAVFFGSRCIWKDTKVSLRWSQSRCAPATRPWTR